MNAVQRAILAIAVLAIAGMVVLPPWQQRYEGPQLIWSRPVKYAPIWDPPETDGYKTMAIDVTRLVMQVGGVVLITPLLLLMLHSRKKAEGPKGAGPDTQSG